jgi:hypothetical protein
MTTSPWANFQPPQEPQSEFKPFFYGFGSKEMKERFLARNQELKEKLEQASVPILVIMTYSVVDVLVVSYRDDTDTIWIDPEIPDGFFRMYHGDDGKAGFKEFNFDEKRD